MGKNELSEGGTLMVRDNMANFRRDTRKTRVTRNHVGKTCLTVCTTVRRADRAGSQPVYKQCTNTKVQVELIVETEISLHRNYNVGIWDIIRWSEHNFSQSLLFPFSRNPLIYSL